MSDKMREEFESAWDNGLFPLAFKEDYRLCLEVWKASRAALVVELPDGCSDTCFEEGIERDDVIAAIEAAGVTIK